MTVVDLSPGSDAWLKLVTASKVAAILGLSPYESPRSLWYAMKGYDVRDPEVSAVKKRGHYLEPAILAWWADQHPEVYVHSRGSTFKFLGWAAVTVDAMAFDLVQLDGGEMQFVVEAKSSDRDEEWGKPGTDEVPAYYAAQAMFAMHVTGTTRTYMPMITSHLEFREYVIEYDRDVAEGIMAVCRAFYDSLAADEPPELDAHPATYTSLRRLNRGIEDREITLDVTVAREYVEAKQRLKDAEADVLFTSSRLIEAMGTAKRAVCAGQTIAYRQNTASGVPALYASRRPVDLDKLNESE